MLISFYIELKRIIKVFILRMVTLNIKGSMVIISISIMNQKFHKKKYYVLTVEYNIDHDHIYGC